MKKLYERKGLALIFWVLILAILVLLVLILLPKFQSGSEASKRDIDRRHEQTAEDSALMNYTANEEFTAIYDMKYKKFVEPESAATVEPYGEASNHQGKVICVRADKNGKIVLKWIDPKNREQMRAILQDGNEKVKIKIPY